MQVTIGIKHAARELTLDTTASQADGLAAVSGAAGEDISLSDDQGRKSCVPAGSLAYVEVGEASPRRVGFGV